MDTQTFKRIARLLKAMYAEMAQEALKEGIDITSPEYDELMSAARARVLEEAGYTIEQYREAKERVSGTSKIEALEMYDNLDERILQLEKLYVPTMDDIASVAKDVAEAVVQPPQIINKIVKETVVEKIIQPSEEKPEKPNKKLERKVSEMEKRIENIKIPEPFSMDEVREAWRNDFGYNLKSNIDILGMPDWRKLAIGLQEQIDTNANTVGVGTISLATGTTGTDVNVSGSPANLGGTITLNIPDASATARGVVTTGTQTFAGNKTFTGRVDIGASAPSSPVAGLNIVRSTNGSALRMEVPATDSTVYDYYLGNTAGNAYIRMNYQRMELFRNGGSVFIAATGSTSNLELSSLSHVHIQNTSASGRSVFMGQAPATTTYKLSVQNNLQLWGTAPEFDIFNSSFVTYGRLAVGSSAFSIATVQAFPIAISINSGTQAARFTSTGKTLIGTHTTQSGTGQMEVRGEVISSGTSPYITRFSTSTTEFLDVGINSSGQAVFTSSSTYYKFGGSSISFMEMRSVAGNVNIKFIDGGSLDVESGGTLSNSTNADKVFSVISAGVSTTATGNVQNALITMVDARSSGSAGYSGIRIAGTINSGSSTSTVRGLYVNNTITAAFGYRAIEAVAGSGFFGFYQSGAGSNYFEGTVLIGSTTATGGKVQIRATTEQVRIEYDASNYYSTTVSSAGAVTFNAVGASAGFTFSDSITISDAKDVILDTTTGTKIGTSTSQKIGLWNTTPDVQPTTAITAAAFTANTSGIADDSATFGGYTIGQIVAALKRIGALA